MASCFRLLGRLFLVNAWSCINRSCGGSGGGVTVGFGGVDGHVLAEVVRPSKGFRTHLAFVWLFARVRPLVPCQIPLGSESYTTRRAGVGLLAHVRAAVLSPVLSVLTCDITLGAAIRLGFTALALLGLR